MFDDSRLRKVKNSSPPTPIQISQRLPSLRSINPKGEIFKISHPPQINFSEFSVLNQMQLPTNRPPQIPITNRSNNPLNIQTTNKIRSVSFIDFSDALFTVAKLTKIEERNTFCNHMIKKLIRNNRPTQNKGERKKDAKSVPLPQKRIVNIFNYPILKANDQIPDKEKAIEPLQKKLTLKTRNIDNTMEKQQEPSDKSHLSIKNIEEQRKRSLLSQNTVKLKIKCIERAKSSIEEKNQQHYKPKKEENIEDKNKLFDKNKKEENVQLNEKENDYKPFLKEKVFCRSRPTKSSINAKKQEKNNEEEEKIVKKENRPLTLLLIEEKTMLEPWKVQDSQPDEN